LIGDVRDRTIEAILRYGDRAKLILETALKLSKRAERELGDFSYKEIVEAMREAGYNYDPKLILRALERDYGIIQTTYRTSNQHWWKFVDGDKVAAVIGNNDLEDPDLVLLETQIRSLGLEEMESKLSSLMRRPVLTTFDKSAFRVFAFEELPRVIDLYKRASSVEELQDLALRLKKVIFMASEVSRRLDAKENRIRFGKEEGKGKDRDVDGLRLPDSQDPLADRA